MLRKKIKMTAITEASFRPYGKIIGYAGSRGTNKKNLFRIVVKQPGSGWRIAYLVVRDKKITRLERHPGSFESFEPVSGRGLLYVSTRKDSRLIKCFLLNKPVVLKKGLWHGIVTSSHECEVKIVENSSVKCVYWPVTF
jgi:ureidoglycolate hydrolase